MKLRPYYIDKHGVIYKGNSLRVLRHIRSNTAHCIITSPPYWQLRNYQVDHALGMEKSAHEFIDNLVEVFHEVKRIMHPSGMLWLVIDDTYVTGTKKHLNLKEKNMIGIPWKLAFALQKDGWILREDIIWHKPNLIPKPKADGCVRNHEYIFRLTKNQKCYFDQLPIMEPAKDVHISKAGVKYNPDDAESMIPNNTNIRRGDVQSCTLNEKGESVKNRRTVWTIPPAGFRGKHIAPFPSDMVHMCISASTSLKGVCSICGYPKIRVTEKVQDAEFEKVVTKEWIPSCDCNSDFIPAVVLDPFLGSGTSAVTARRLGRRYIGVELSKEACEDAVRVINNQPVTPARNKTDKKSRQGEFFND